MAKKKANKRTAWDGADQAPFFAAPIIWFNYPESSRCKIPRRQTKSAVYYGAMGLFVGLLLAFTMPVILTTHASHNDLGAFLTFFFSSALSLPLAVLFFWKGLLLLRGRTELVIDAKRLCVITRLGPF